MDAEKLPPYVPESIFLVDTNAYIEDNKKIIKLLSLKLYGLIDNTVAFTRLQYLGMGKNM